MNNISISGMVVDKPTTELVDGKNVARFTITNRRAYTRNTYDNFNIRAVGRSADFAAQWLHAESNVEITGFIVPTENGFYIDCNSLNFMASGKKPKEKEETDTELVQPKEKPRAKITLTELADTDDLPF